MKSGADGIQLTPCGRDHADTGDHRRRRAAALVHHLRPVGVRHQVDQHQDREDAEEVGGVLVALLHGVDAEPGDREGRGHEGEQHHHVQHAVRLQAEQDVQDGEHRVGAGDRVDRLPSPARDPDQRTGQQIAALAEDRARERHAGRAAALARDADQTDQAVRHDRRGHRDDERLPDVQVVRHDQARAHRQQQHADVGAHPGGEQFTGPGGAFVIRDLLDASGLESTFGLDGFAHQKGARRGGTGNGRDSTRVDGAVTIVLCSESGQ